MKLLIIFLIALLAAAVVLIAVMLKKQSERKKLLDYFQKEYLNILRIEALNKSIMSPLDRDAVKTGPKKMLVRLREKSDLTDKTYLLDMKTPWTIGRKPGENAICIRGDRTVSTVHCMLKQQNGTLYLVDMGSKNSTMYRPASGPYSKTGVYIPQKGAQPLTTGDAFCVGFTTFEVTVFESSRGII